MLVAGGSPGEALLRALEKWRGRNDRPVRAMWNSVIAGVVFQHESAESLRRELLRNGELRQECGFNPVRGAGAAPSPDACRRFLKKLMKEPGRIEQMFDALVGQLPELGRQLAVDGKALPTHARGLSGPETNWSMKKKGRREGGKLLGEGHERVRLQAARSRLPGRAEDLSADKGCDSAKNIALLWDRHSIKPLIGIRSVWKDEDRTKLLDGARADNIVYDESWRTCCQCPQTGDQREMAFAGFEKDRNCLKCRCPAEACGLQCAGCPQQLQVGSKLQGADGPRSGLAAGSGSGRPPPDSRCRTCSANASGESLPCVT